MALAVPTSTKLKFRDSALPGQFIAHVSGSLPGAVTVSARFIFPSPIAKSS